MKKLDGTTPRLTKVLQGLGKGTVVPSKKPIETPTEQKPVEKKEASAATLAAQKVLLGQVDQKTPKTTTTATAAAEIANRSQGGGFVGFLKKAVLSSMVAFALLATPSIAKADVVFLDHNDAPSEIAVAKRLASSKGEAFFLVRPDAASLDSVFSKAEAGGIDLRHLILSGHSGGTSVWGQGADGTHRETSMDEMKELKLKYPKAFAQVKHVHFMSCYAGSAGNSAQWSAVFPNAKIAGFWGSGPSKTQPAAHKMLENSEMSMRALDGRNLSPQQALIAAKAMSQQAGSNVTKFAVRLPTNDGASVHFALGEPKTSLDVVMDRVDVLRARAFDNYMNPVGQDASFASPPTNHQRSPLRDFYNALHSYLNVLPADDYNVSTTQDEIKTTIRLIYFDVIQTKMQSTHGGTFASADSALSAAGVDVKIGDVSKLTRAQVFELSDKLSAVGEIQWASFAKTHAADLATVNAFSNAQGLGDITAPTSTSSSWEIDGTLDALKALTSPPTNVIDAVNRLTTALTEGQKQGVPTAVTDAQKLLDEGLVQLSPTVIPSTWIE
ncbi:MAG: hypothetical protein Q8O67_05800 [Deltaproteobacteria bacterium]|nr:hypothetical protein [Deltaproteobacteria bacterium]